MRYKVEAGFDSLELGDQIAVTIGRPLPSNGIRALVFDALAYYEFHDMEWVPEFETLKPNFTDELKSDLIFKTIAANTAKEFNMYFDEEGKFRGVNNSSRTFSSYESSNNSSTDRMNEDSPLNSSVLNTINTPSSKDKASAQSEVNGESNSESSYVKLSELREYSMIRDKLVNSLRTEIERFIYQYQLVY